MTMTQETKKLKMLMSTLLKQTQDALANEKRDKKTKLFLGLMAALAKSATLHFELQKFESEQRFKIPKQQMNKLRNTHYKALGMFVKIPAESKSSLYEMCTILAIADILAAHSTDNNSSQANSKPSKRSKG